MPAFRPGQIVVHLRSRITEDVRTAFAETGGNAGVSYSDARADQFTKQFAWQEAKSRIAEPRVTGIYVKVVAPIESADPGANIVDEARREYVLQTQDPVLSFRRD